MPLHGGGGLAPASPYPKAPRRAIDATRRLSAALDDARQEGWLAPNLETGAVTRQKRFAGTDSRPRFVFFREAFLGAAERKAW